MKKPFVLSLILGLSALPAIATAAEDPASAQAAQQDLAESAGKQAERETGRSVSKEKENLEHEAIEALHETQVALMALDKGDTQAAQDALAKAVGKLELLVSRHPELGLIPVDVRVEQIEVVASDKEIRKAIDQAEDYLDHHEVQKARHLLRGLASELVIRTLNIPLATYPDAIKAVSPLIEAGKLDEARDALNAALNTLVVTERIVPLPVMRARILLQDAEKLTEKADRSDEEQQRLRHLLAAAENELRRAELLGYGHRRDYRRIYRQIRKIERRIENKGHEKGLFERIKEALENIGEASDEAAKEHVGE